MIPYEERFHREHVGPTLAADYAEAGRTVGDDETWVVWPARVERDVCERGWPYARSLAAHRAEWRSALGLSSPSEPTLSRLHRERRWLSDESGARFSWRMVTAFALPYFVATGRLTQADDLLDWARGQGFTGVRVLSTAAVLFDLPPDAGVDALPEVCRLAAVRGLRVHAAALVDTARRVYDYRRHIDGIVAMMATHPNLLVEGANEPRHATQDPAIVPIIRSMTDVYGGVYAQGSAHGVDDESDEFAGGDYITTHFDRADGDSGWRWVRHTKEGWNQSTRTNRFVVNDEPRRDDLAEGKHLALGALCRICGIGDTFHYAGGLQGEQPAEADTLACDRRREGWEHVDGLDNGAFVNAGWTGSPVTSFTGALRAYSRIDDRVGVTLLLDAQSPQIRWGAGWQPVDVLADVDGCRLLRIERT